MKTKAMRVYAAIGQLMEVSMEAEVYELLSKSAVVKINYGPDSGCDLYVMDDGSVVSDAGDFHFFEDERSARDYGDEFSKNYLMKGEGKGLPKKVRSGKDKGKFLRTLCQECGKTYTIKKLEKEGLDCDKQPCLLWKYKKLSKNKEGEAV